MLVLAMAAAASAATHAQPRHVEIIPPTNRAILYLDRHGSTEVGLFLEEPDTALLVAGKFDRKTRQSGWTIYGAHFDGSLPRGRITARFGSVGSISLRFHPAGRGREGRPEEGCRGRPRTEESGNFVGSVHLRGEGGYFNVAARRVPAVLGRTFRLRCRVAAAFPGSAPPSLEEAVESRLVGVPKLGTSLATLEIEGKEAGREVAMSVSHVAGAPAGAVIQAVAFEHQGKMPVGRVVAVPEAPAGTLLTTLPGERPPSATLKPPAPFSGEAEYVAESPTSHRWTGTLAVQFPGLLQPLVGPDVYSSLCVASPLREWFGCDYKTPNWEVAETDGRHQWRIR
jgi:hypothetical protein